MKKALVLILTIAALLFAPNFERISADGDPIDDLPDAHVPINIQG